MLAASSCCARLAQQVDWRCDQHRVPRSCPDQLIGYTERFDEYGLLVHDGERGESSSSLLIGFCPFCGSELPPSRRDEWFDRLEALHLDPEHAPEELLVAGWWARP